MKMSDIAEFLILTIVIWLLAAGTVNLGLGDEIVDAFHNIYIGSLAMYIILDKNHR